MQSELIVGEEVGLVRRQAKDVVLMPVMDVPQALKRLEQLQEFCASYLQESKDGGGDGGDYGVIPGAGKKKVLLKSGAEKLCDVYGLADRYRILSKIEDFEHGLFDYTIECTLVRKTDEMFVGSGLGSCSSYEAKYRWRDSQRKCPQCQAEAIIKGKEEFGGGFLCWAKKGGCGAKFSATDPAIIDQKVGRTENPDLNDSKNTVLKIAKKRSKIDAVIGVTQSSGIFTQDLEEHEYVAPPVEPAAAVPAATPDSSAGRQAGETHAEKIARVKAEAEAAKSAAPVHAPAPAPVEPAAKPAAAKPTVEASADGSTLVTGINVRNGPMVVKDGKTVPSWGPLYIIAFGSKVSAPDGVMVTDATTFDQKIAAAAELARDEKRAVTPTLEAGKRKGSYNLVSL